METDGVWSVNQNTAFLNCRPTYSQPICLTEAHHTSFLNYARQQKGREAVPQGALQWVASGTIQWLARIRRSLLGIVLEKKAFCSPQ